MIPKALRTPLAVSLLALPASAQYINRATWLGDEQEPFRRDYPQDQDYFVDRWSYVDAPPWWRGEDFDFFGNRLFAAGGSVSSKRLTLEAQGNVGVDMGSGFTGRLNYLQSENQTTQYQRIAFGIDAAFSDAAAGFVQLEGTPDKSRADLSFGLELFRTRRSNHRLMFTLVDFSQGKSDVFEYDEKPYALMFAGQTGDPERFDLLYELGLQLPFEQRSLQTDDRFRMHRAIGSVRARKKVGERERLILGFDGELTAKELESEEPQPGALEDGDIELGRVSAEWWRQGGGGREYSLGAYYLHVDEDYDAPSAPELDAFTRRRELMLFGRAHLGLGGAWSVEPYLIGGRVDLQRDAPELLPDERSFLGFQGKLGSPLRYDFSERAFLRIDLSLQLDEFAFGGGGVQLVASF